MNKWKILAILFTLFTFGALKESYRIFTSAAPDIAANRTQLMIIGVVITLSFLVFAIWFWKKSAATKKYL